VNESGLTTLNVADRRLFSEDERELRNMLDRFARSDISGIRTPTKTRHSLGATIALAGVGFLIGRTIYAGAAECPHAGRCTAYQFRLTAQIWLPAAGALLGLFAF
jgi:hypothetical protein